MFTLATVTVYLVKLPVNWKNNNFLRLSHKTNQETLLALAFSGSPFSLGDLVHPASL